jgi:hypothetical protein
MRRLIGIEVLLLAVTLAQQQTQRDQSDINVADVVVRGPDWDWGDQDGGIGGGGEGSGTATGTGGSGDERQQGIVVEILPWKGEVDPLKFGVRVVWMNGASNVYRWGARDKFDVAVVGRVSKETAAEMRDRYYEGLHERQLYRDLPASTFERGVLIEIFEQSNNAIAGTPPSWQNTRGWAAAAASRGGSSTANAVASDPCLDRDWDGVVCENGKVIALDLANNGLRGRLAALPFERLPNLRSLNLAGNALTGPLPPGLA